MKIERWFTRSIPVGLGLVIANLQAADPTASQAMATRLKVRLKAAPAATDACVQCHVTGFQLAGGYPAADSARTAAVAMVGCESGQG